MKDKDLIFVKAEMVPYWTEVACSHCITGYMEFTGSTKLCYPPLYTHKCTNCGKFGYYKEKYPEIKYEKKQ